MRKVARTILAGTACVLLGTVGGYPLTGLALLVLSMWADKEQSHA